MKPVLIKLFVGVFVCMICMTLFAFILLRLVLSTEYYHLASDGSVSIAPDPDRVYYIMAETSYELSLADLAGFNTRLNTTHSDPANSFTVNDAAGKSRHRSTGLNTSTYRASFTEIIPSVNDPISFTIAPDTVNPNATILVQSTARAGIGAFIAAFVFAITGFVSMLYVTVVFYVGLYRMNKNNKHNTNTAA
jgi:hypothetical protein